MGEDEDGDISRNRGGSESDQPANHDKYIEKDSFHEISMAVNEEEDDSSPANKVMHRKPVKYSVLDTPANTKEVEGEETVSGENSGQLKSSSSSEAFR